LRAALGESRCGTTAFKGWPPLLLMGPIEPSESVGTAVKGRNVVRFAAVIRTHPGDYPPIFDRSRRL
jgi:hypothetical protein